MTRKKIMHIVGYVAGAFVIVSIITCFAPYGRIFFRLMRYSPDIIQNAIPASNTFRIEGTITDEEGKVISNALIGVTDITVSHLGGSAKKNDRTIQPNGKYFMVESSGYEKLNLDFTAIGYDPVFLQYTVGGKYSNVSIVLKKQVETSQPSQLKD